LLNRAIQQTYPPGSTFKVITSAAALSSGKFTPDSTIPAPNELKLPQTSSTIRNFGGETCGDGKVDTLADSLRISCNTAFAQLGLDLGQDTLRSQAEKFGFGQGELALPTTVARSVFPGSLNPPQLAQSSIGQFDVQVTPLQMAMVAAGVANGGDVMKPYLVREVQAPDLSVLDRARPSVYRHAVDRPVADQLNAMMQLVVASGTGTGAQIPGVPVAGKTGTAQHAVGQAPHAWFIGFAPANDPQVAVAVLVEDGGTAGPEATGGAVAAPIARDVMRAVLGR
jgi:peptidoglycan glycosyltransferase